MGDTSFIQKQNSRKVVLFKGSSNVLSKFSDADFHMNFFVYVSADKYVTPPLLIIPGKRFNINVIKGCNIEGYNITTAPKGSINSTFLLSCIEFFTNSVPNSVTRLLVLVYCGWCSHYNDYIF